MMKPRKSSSWRKSKRKRGDPKATRTVTRAAPKEPTIPRAHRARVAIILLKTGMKRRDWRKVSSGLWLLESLKCDSARRVDRYADIDAYLGAEIALDDTKKLHLDEELRTKNDT